ncbi:hypothetical protein Mal64_04190 [Pseudobythopirellula maris]|uniref:Uncharacterized protein n=1 Tax=Pseudobythopirellula maris TaxID=2527991 RepID=A0A5C5ZS46_9BACT|nr:response regulator [Pseudobythopirellula maris]TWT90036.1 hypothetical protein Mal64_04190 [Pseudobythopirellula maris]
MPRAVYFLKECPTCGRSLQVRVEYLGKKVACQHCSATFRANEDANDKIETNDDALLRRAEELIRTAEESGIGLGAC